jgi:UDP-N-acetylglucosamine 2-epimerase
MKIVTVLGTRPEIIKMFPLFHELDKNFNHLILHTGQHYDYLMHQVFFDELKIKSKIIRLKTISKNFGDQMGNLIKGIYKQLRIIRPDYVIIQGDTNSALAGALVAKRMQIKVIHIEAGCRSGNSLSPEEQNRILIDAISDIKFCSDFQSFSNLKKMNLHINSYVSGSSVFDALRFLKKKLQKSNLDALGLKSGEFVIFTMHRFENVTNEEILGQKISFINQLSQKIPLVFPVHPGTLRYLKKNNLKLCENVKTLEPLPYFKFLSLLKHARFVITDSGGIQEESVYFNKPCLILRDETEWRRLIKIKKNFLFPKIDSKLRSTVDSLIYDDNFYKKVARIKCHESKPGATKFIINHLKKNTPSQEVSS